MRWRAPWLASGVPLKDRIDIESKPWLALLRHTPLGILTDLDGTLLPLASRPDAAQPDLALQELVRELAALPGVTLAIVSGRPHETLERFFPPPRAAFLVAEHGAWRAGAEGWESALSLDDRALDSLVAELRRLQAKHPLSVVERKTWSVAFHYRMCPPHRKSGLLVQVGAIVEPWLAAHPHFERLAGAEVLEVRPQSARKSNAVLWMRERCGPECRLLMVGDDTTDEDMFAAGSADDVSVLVSAEPSRVTHAQWRLEGTEAVHGLYRDIIALRGQEHARPSVRLMPVAPQAVSVSGAPYHLLVLSNRLPDLRSADASSDPRKRNVGGLVSALRPVLEARQGIWLGWSGQTRPESIASPERLDVVEGLSLASVDFPAEWHRRYYNGFSNSALWPLLHSFPSRVKYAHADWEAYTQANAAFAGIAARLVAASETIWVHDYHLLLIGRFLRALGHRGAIGIFQHVPFPGPDIFFLLPWAASTTRRASPSASTRSESSSRAIPRGASMSRSFRYRSLRGPMFPNMPSSAVASRTASDASMVNSVRPIGCLFVICIVLMARTNCHSSIAQPTSDMSRRSVMA